MLLWLTCKFTCFYVISKAFLIIINYRYNNLAEEAKDRSDSSSSSDSDSGKLLSDVSLIVPSFAKFDFIIFPDDDCCIM